MGQKNCKRFHRHNNRQPFGVFHRVAMNIRPPKMGVSLIELLTVISLIGIMSAIVTTRYSTSLCRFRVEASAERVKVDLNMARRRACIMGKNISVNFDTGTHSYIMPNVASLDKIQQPYQVNLAAAPFYATFDSVSFPGGTGGETQIVFDYYGNPDSGGSVVVRCGGATKTVSLNATTGEATIP